MKSFKQYISEARPNLIKGWIHKSGKIATSTTDYSVWHIKQVMKNPSKFGLSKNKILKILADAGDSMSAPEDYAEEQYESLVNGMVDNDVYIEEYLFKKGYCMFVIDKTHGKVEGWDVASTRSAAKAIDDKYLPFERDGFKLFEIKTVRGADKYHTNKLDWYDWVGGKKKRNYVSPMAQFREATNIGRVTKGWIHESGKIASTANDFDEYHIIQLIKNFKNFGLTEKKMVAIIKKDDDVKGDEDTAEHKLDLLLSGKKDFHPGLENYVIKNGWCRFTLTRSGGGLFGKDLKTSRKALQKLDDKYFIAEQKTFKHFFVETKKKEIEKIESKFEYYNFLKGKAKPNYVSPMAQFRESTNQVEYVLWGVPPGEREEVLVLDAPGGKPITKLSSAKKYKAVLEKEHGVTKIRIQTIDFSQDLSKMFTNKNLVR